MTEVQNFPKPYLSHPKFKSNVPYMHFDSLEEIYAMVKSNLYFEQLDKTGRIDFRDKSDRSYTAVPIFYHQQQIQSPWTMADEAR